MFHQQIAGEEVEEESEQPEQPENLDQNVVEEPIAKPSAETIANRLVAQGYTMEDMVKCFLIDHEEYDAEAEIHERFADRMFGKFRQIISNYPREQRQSLPGLVQRQSLPGLVQRQDQEQPRHQSSRLRVREEVEDNFAQLQNRYQLLQDDDEEV